jgi:hypothetical protein
MGGMNITALQFGIYRDGDNNLDTVQSPVIDQAFRVSAEDSRIAFNVEDTTARHDLIQRAGKRTETYEIRDGQISTAPQIDAPHDPSSRTNLARFVANTLDAAQRNGSKQTWLDLVDHGGGDGGGLQSDTHHSVMSSTDIAGAIADGIALHAQEHPDDAGRAIDGVVANQCQTGAQSTRELAQIQRKGLNRRAYRLRIPSVGRPGIRAHPATRLSRCHRDHRKRNECYQPRYCSGSLCLALRL